MQQQLLFIVAKNEHTRCSKNGSIPKMKNKENIANGIKPTPVMNH